MSFSFKTLLLTTFLFHKNCPGSLENYAIFVSLIWFSLLNIFLWPYLTKVLQLKYIFKNYCYKTLFNRSSSSPPQPQYWLLKPLIASMWLVFSMVTPPKLCWKCWTKLDCWLSIGLSMGNLAKLLTQYQIFCDDSAKIMLKMVSQIRLLTQYWTQHGGLWQNLAENGWVKLDSWLSMGFCIVSQIRLLTQYRTQHGGLWQNLAGNGESNWIVDSVLDPAWWFWQNLAGNGESN
jgi:hypothetical protein